MRVLVADDDPLQREVMAALLGSWGYEAVLAADGAAAWGILVSEDAPRLALLDWMMPAPDGPELCRRIRTGPSATETYVILVTSRNKGQDLAEGLAAGADDYVIKPADDTELRARLQVGARMVALQQRLLQAEGLRVLSETAGAAAHEIRQPLALIQATTQLCQRDQTLAPEHQRRHQAIIGAVRRIDEIIERMSTVQKYDTRQYPGGSNIVDFGLDQ